MPHITYTTKENRKQTVLSAALQGSFLMEEKIMHRKKKLPVAYIIVFVLAFILSVSISALLPKLNPFFVKLQGCIFFGAWLLLSLGGVAMITVLQKRKK